MSVFSYQASDSVGSTVRGSIDAGTAAQALALLAAQNLRVFDLQAGPVANAPLLRAGAGGSASGRGVSTTAVALVLYELATLLGAGVPLADAVNNSAQGREGQAAGEALAGVYSKLRGGSAFSDALADSGLPLPRYANELIRAGEMTGKLGAALRSAAQQMEQELAFAREARNALIYPAVLVASGLAATLMVFVFVVPKFASILNNPKADIPLFSLYILRAGLWLADHRLVALGCVAAVVLGAALAWRSAAARLALWNGLSRLPLSAPWVAHSELARWATMLSVMLHNAVPLLEALALARSGLRASALVHKAGQISADVRGGKTLGESMRQYGFADGTTINLVAVGEKSGALAQTTQVIGEMHRTQSQQLLKRFLVLLEPLTILAISVVLGGIMISVMLAVTSLTNVI